MRPPADRMRHAIAPAVLTAACGARPELGPVPVEGARAELDALSFRGTPAT